jgi:hypothetical protein
VKARCIKLINSRGNPQERSSWLTIGRVYDVLEVLQDIHSRWLLRVIGNGVSGVALFPLEQFEIVSRKMPTAWAPFWNTHGGFALTTEVLAQAGFWEAYYERDPAALRAFEDERKKIVDADP